MGTSDSAVLLKWHAAVQEQAGGLGSVLRVMADKGAVI